MSKLNYEELLRDLDVVIGRLSQDNTGLEESVDLFTRGIGIIGECRRQLDEAMEKVNVLIRQHNGHLEKTDLSVQKQDGSVPAGADDLR